MKDFDEQFLQSLGLMDFQKSMEDPLVTSVNAEAAIATQSIDPETFGLGELPFFADDVTKYLDSKIEKLVGSRAEVTGQVLIISQDPPVPISLDGHYAQFQGFAARNTEGKREYGYYMKLFCDENGRPHTKEEYKEVGDRSSGFQFSLYPLFASIDSVQIDFDVMHPVRALNWLNDMYPDAVAELDAQLIYDGKFNAENQLLALRDFALEVPEDMPYRDFSLLVRALQAYAESLLVLDTSVPYAFFVYGIVQDQGPDGELREDTVIDEPATLLISTKGVLPYVANNYNGENQTEGKMTIAFGVVGTRHNEDIDEPATQVLIPCVSIHNVTSLRNACLREDEVNESTQ